MRRLLKVLVWGSLIIVGLFVALGVLGVLLAPAPQQTESNPAPGSAAPKPEPKPEPADYFKLSGTAKGASCSVLDDDSQRSIDLPVPSQRPLNVGWMGMGGVTCQKSGLADSTLTVELHVNGETKRASTLAQAGVVSLSVP